MYLPDRAKFLAKWIYQKHQENLIGTDFNMKIPYSLTDRITLLGTNGYTEELELNYPEYQHENSYEIEASLQALQKHDMLKINRDRDNWIVSINPTLFEAVEVDFGEKTDTEIDHMAMQIPTARPDIIIFNSFRKSTEDLTYTTFGRYNDEQLLDRIRDAILSQFGAESSYYKKIAKVKLHYPRALLENKQPRFEEDKKTLLAVLNQILNNLYLTVFNIDNKSLIAHPIFGEPYQQNGEYPQVMVLMPFKEEMKSIYQDHILKVSKNLGLTCARADDWLTNKVIMREVWSGIYYADICIVDCTGVNPNVFYELGIAHTIGKECILIAQSREDTEKILPFDIQDIRAIIYSKQNMSEFEKKLEATIRNTLRSATS